MRPIAAAQFTRLFRELDAARRVEFVAALWAQRGWQTTVDGDTVVATRRDETKRILVVDPGRFGSPALDGVDVLVTARDRDAVRAAAASAGARYLPPADVREALLYGLARDEARTLFEETFDRPLESTEQISPSVADRLRETASAVEQAVSERTNSRHLLVLLVVSLLVVAGAAGSGVVPNSNSATVTPIGTFTPGDAGAVGESTPTRTPGTPGVLGTADDANNGRPPGVGAETLTDPRLLANAHFDAVIGMSRTVRLDASGPTTAPILNGATSRNYTARIETPRRYRFDARYTYPTANGSAERLVAVSLFGDGETNFRQRRTENETTYQRYPIETTGDASGGAMDIRNYLRTYLAGSESSVTCAATLTGGDCFAYRIVVSGSPSQLSEDAADYRAVAVVQESGLVSSLAVNYTIPNTAGERVPVTFSVDYDDVGKTTVTPPEWLDTAKNETDG